MLINSTGKKLSKKQTINAISNFGSVQEDPLGSFELDDYGLSAEIVAKQYWNKIAGNDFQDNDAEEDAVLIDTNAEPALILNLILCIVFRFHNRYKSCEPVYLSTQELGTDKFSPCFRSYITGSSI